MLIHKRFSKGRACAMLVLAALFMTSLGAMAQAPEFPSPTKSDEFLKILMGIAKYITKFGTPIAALFLILSGFMFVSAQGNKEKLKTARTMLIWTLVGTAIVVGAWPIAEMVKNLADKL